MLTHVVCFRFADPDQAREARDRIAAMAGRVPALLGLEVGLDITRSERSYDLVLISRHADAAGLAAYQADPVHAEVLAFLRSCGPQAVAVDFTS